MKNSKFLLKTVIVTISIVFASSFIRCYGQVSALNNNPTFGAYLGWNGAQNLDFKTNNVLRVGIMQTQTNTINGFGGIAQGGFMGLCDDLTLINGVGPYSMLHINGSNVGAPQQQGFRPWMRYGMTVTSNRDLMYVGQKADSLDKTDAVIAWADNGSSSQVGPDNLRFIFTGETNYGGVSTSHLLGGQEVMRLSPAPDANMGVGNFSSNGLGEAPTERIDVDGTIRLRQVADDTPDVLITGRMQTVNPTTGDYVLNHLEFSGNPNEVLNGDGVWVEMEAADCDWEVIENVPGIEDVVTGHGDDCYPAGHAGVGVTVPQAKLDVYHGQTQVNPKPQAGLISWDETIDETFPVANGLKVQLRRADIEGIMGYGAHVRAQGSQRNWGGYFEAQAGSVTAANIGVHGEAFGLIGSSNTSSNYGGYFQGGSTNSNSVSYGVFANAASGQSSYGVQCSASQGSTINHGLNSSATATSGSSPVENIGVFGRGNGNSTVATNMGVAGYAVGGANNYGVYGQAPVGTGSYAGYFTGNFTSTGTFLLVSDEQFKTNVEDYSSGLEIITQLAPKTYDFLHEQYPNMSLSQGNQYGLIAQELAEVVPELVETVVSPTILDSLGNEISSSIEYQAVNYIGLTPILISAVKEQQAQIAAQDESIAQLQESLNNQNEALAQMMEQLATMQQQINQCCNASDDSKSMPGGAIEPQDLNNQKPIEGGNELFQNIPNPFRESTTISYLLEEGGRVQLNIYDKTGKVLTTLIDATQGPGRYSSVWNANGMPSGVYHYALYVNGELLVKRAIKLQE